MIRIIQRNGNHGKSQWFTVLCTGKNNILHIGTTELLYALFAKHPSYCIANVTFTTSVWADNTGNTVMKLKLQFVCKRLKSMYFYAFQIHLFCLPFQGNDRAVSGLLFCTLLGSAAAFFESLVTDK